MTVLVDQGTDAWVSVCPIDLLLPDRGVAALVGERAVAVFRCSPDDQLYAIANDDPFSGASVLSRGILGSCGDELVIASPLHKQRFALRTGVSLDDPSVRIDTWPVRLVGRWVVVASRPLPVPAHLRETGA